MPAADTILDCPQCGRRVERISYSVNFMMIDETRYRTSSTWDIHHDAEGGVTSVCQFYDGELTVGTETPSGVLWEWDEKTRYAQLYDLQERKVILRWREPEQERAGR